MNKIETTTTNQQPIGQYRPNLCFYRANPKGTGAAIKMNLHPAHDNVDGCIMLTIANQQTIGERQKGIFPTFDWEHAITIKLDFHDLACFLQVFRGEQESINDDKGLYHRSLTGSTSIRLRHLLDPIAGYSLDVVRVGGKEKNDTVRAHFLFDSAEAYGICEAITGSLCFIAFGVPMLVPHDTSAYRAASKGRCHAFVA